MWLKIPTGRKADQLAIYNRGQGVELGATERQHSNHLTTLPLQNSLGTAQWHAALQAFSQKLKVGHPRGIFFVNFLKD